jgi:hypothetical protein
MATSAPRPGLACDAAALEADLRAVALLARLALAGCRHGLMLRVRNTSPELQDLIAFTGLDAVLVVEPGREPEEREEMRSVEEEGQLGDPIA